MNYLSFSLPGEITYESSGKYTCEKAGLFHPRRKLNSFVLLMGLKGALGISQGGKEYLMNEDEYLILRRNTEHYCTVPYVEGLSFCWCHFDLRDYSITESNLPSERVVTLPEHGRIARPDRTQILFHQLLDNSCGSGIYKDQICKDTLRLILLELADGSALLANGNRSLTAKVTEWIRIHCAEIRSVDDVADAFGYNSRYLTTLLRSSTGKTIGGHLRDSRIEAASRLLVSTQMPVSQIAWKCGFRDEKYFSKVFFACKKLTPTGYRSAYCRVHYNKN